MIYTATIRRENGTEYESKIDTSRGRKWAEESAANIADSYGDELVSVTGEEDPVDDQQDPVEQDEKQPDEQKTTEEPAEEQAETKQATPNKTGDVRPNR